MHFLQQAVLPELRQLTAVITLEDLTIDTTNLKGQESGEVGEITVDGVIVDGKGYTSYSDEYNKFSYPEDAFDYENIATPASADNISIGTNAHSLVSFGLFKRGATVAANNTYLIYQKDTVRPYTLAIEDWNHQTAGDDTELNYFASLSGNDQGKGDWLINIKNISDKADLVLDSTHKIFGIPTCATAELKKYSEEAYKGYKFVNLKYNNAKDAVTISGGENIDNAFIAPKTAAARILSLTLQQAKTA